MAIREETVVDLLGIFTTILGELCGKKKDFAGSSQDCIAGAFGSLVLGLANNNISRVLTLGSDGSTIDKATLAPFHGSAGSLYHLLRKIPISSLPGPDPRRRHYCNGSDICGCSGLSKRIKRELNEKFTIMGAKFDTLSDGLLANRSTNVL